MNKNNPLVSVIINCRNGEKYLKESVESILSQSYKNLEIIFFDNKSEDRSFRIVKKFDDKRIKYFKSQKTLKLYHARNLAIKKSKGKYITFLDCDDIWLKDKITKQVKFLSRNKEIKILYSNYYNLFQNKKKKSIKFKKNLKSGFITQNLLDDYSIGILTVIIENKVLKKFFFNQNFNVIGDFDLFLKLSKKYKIAYLNEPLAIYRLHDENFSKKNYVIYIKELKIWLKENIKQYEKENFNLKRIKDNIIKLKIKNLFKNLGRVVQW